MNSPEAMAYAVRTVTQAPPAAGDIVDKYGAQLVALLAAAYGAGKGGK